MQRTIAASLTFKNTAMTALSQLKLAAATPTRDRTPVGRVRRRLLDGLDLQIELAAAADGAGTTVSRTRQRWVKNDTGGKDLRDLPVRLRRWWWRDEAGRVYLGLRHGARLLEIAPGKRAIDVGTMGDLPGQLRLLREAVQTGELDAAIGTAVSPREVPKKEKAPVAGRSASAKAQ